ncbi:MAG: 4a-hydroxytetrahydrobiopterin dehydratase, partial [Actinomycetota bacterium]|nr:4a-hydroxytetrahydrobiopterin dehydratase [Actinomycetota bacterium]
MDYTRLSADEFAALDGLDDWRFLLGAIHAHFRAGSFPGAAALVVAIAEAAEAAQHHPDIDLRYPDRVHVVLTTHATGGLTTLDAELAAQISALAAGAGATAEPTVSQGAEIAIDTLDADRIRPFWAAVLGYKDVQGN